MKSNYKALVSVVMTTIKEDSCEISFQSPELISIFENISTAELYDSVINDYCSYFGSPSKIAVLKADMEDSIVKRNLAYWHAAKKILALNAKAKIMNNGQGFLEKFYPGLNNMKIAERDVTRFQDFIYDFQHMMDTLSAEVIA